MELDLGFIIVILISIVSAGIIGITLLGMAWIIAKLLKAVDKVLEKEPEE